MDSQLIIQNTENWVEKYMKSYDCSHNFKHVMRVKKMAIQIANYYKLSDEYIFIIILGALTHDIADHKYNNGDDNQEELLRNFYRNVLSNEQLDEVVFIAGHVSLSKETSCDNLELHIKYNNIKLQCVQDADRLDSLGSIGIARYFIYGVIKKNSDMDEIVNNLEDRTDILMRYMKTDYGKSIANKKYEIIKMYIDDFRMNY